MRFSIAVAAVLGGLQAVSALKLSPRNAVEREEQPNGAFSVDNGHEASTRDKYRRQVST
ncbi:hypothetical protein IG631_03537 [Alternaria alternata]|nr:hypothetical protein IG631_03537 [Alternaria alternata]